MKKPSELVGALVGLIVTAPLTAVLFFTSTLGLPQVVYDFFAFIRDTLPGGLLIGDHRSDHGQIA